MTTKKTVDSKHAKAKKFGAPNIVDSPPVKEKKDKKTGAIKLQIEERKNPDSDPYVIMVKNASDNTETIRIFAENAKGPINHPYVHVYSRDPNANYENILKEFRAKNVVIGLVYIQKDDLCKRLPFILKYKVRTSAKHVRTVVHKVTIDPYQMQTSVIGFKPPIQKVGRQMLLNQNSWIEVELGADEKMCISFYPHSKETMGYEPK